MEIWLKQDKDAIQFPILPASFGVSIENSHQTVNVQTKGEITILGKKGLKVIDLTSFFPSQDYPFADHTKDREPYEYIDKILEWQEKPLRLTITETDINMACVIQTFTYGEPDGTGDIEFTISLKEYQAPKYTEPEKTTSSVQAEQIGKGSASSTKRETKETQKTYTVKEGDNLWDLAKKFYGSGSKSSKLYQANKNIIEKTAKKHGCVSSSHKGVAGWWIFPGTKLVIPK